MKELTYHPGEIRSMMFDIIDALDCESFTHELLSYLDTTTLRDFTEHLRTNVADIEDVVTYNN